MQCKTAKIATVRGETLNIYINLTQRVVGERQKHVFTLRKYYTLLLLMGI